MTKIIAHRGANRFAPQNTLPAFQKAIELGADGLENDVHLTKDGVIVICHNYSIDETSNGKGKIADYSFDELRKFDFGSYFSPEFAGTQIPRLEEFLDLCRSLEIINIEIKPPLQKNSPIVRQTLDMVKDFGLFDHLLISSFSSDVLVACKEIDSRTKTGMLYSIDEKECAHLEELTDDCVRFAQNIKADALHPFLMFVDEEYIENCHKAGIAVNPWTVNQPYAISTFAEWGVDGVITDTADVARIAIESPESFED